MDENGFGNRDGNRFLSVTVEYNHPRSNRPILGYFMELAFFIVKDKLINKYYTFDLYVYVIRQIFEHVHIQIMKRKYTLFLFHSHSFHHQNDLFKLYNKHISRRLMWMIACQISNVTGNL